MGEIDKLTLLIGLNLWSKENEELIKDLAARISNYKLTLSMLFKTSEKEEVRRELEKAEQEYQVLANERAQLMDVTLEIYVNRRVSERQLFLSLTKPNKEPLFTNEDFNDLDDEDVIPFMNEFRTYSEKTSHKEIQKLSLSPIFMNSFAICENNPMTYYGKPIVALTFNQVELFSHGINFKNILSQADSTLEPELLEDPEKLIEWFNSKKNAERIAQQTMKNRKNRGESTFEAATIVGASSEEMKKAGLTGKKFDIKKLENKSFEEIISQM